MSAPLLGSAGTANRVSTTKSGSDATLRYARGRAIRESGQRAGGTHGYRVAEPAAEAAQDREPGVRQGGRTSPNARIGGRYRPFQWRPCPDPATGSDVPDERKERVMKYMILMYASQQDYDALAGKSVPGKVSWSRPELAAMGAFMESFTKNLAESGELVDTFGLGAPVLTRRLHTDSGVPVVTDGPY